MMNARFSDYISIFFVDIVLIAAFMLIILVLRQGELYILVEMGVYKNVEDLTDKEIISEYNKLKKQSSKLQTRLKHSDSDITMTKRQIRMVSGATNRTSAARGNESDDSFKEDKKSTNGSEGDRNQFRQLRKKETNATLGMGRDSLAS